MSAPLTTPRTDPHPKLTAVPDALLLRGPKHREKARTTALLAWCEQAGFRPTLADIEAERTRRTHTNPGGRGVAISSAEPPTTPEPTKISPRSFPKRLAEG